MPLPRKDSPSSSRSERSAREPGFAQTARGPGPVGKMLSAALAIANAVQSSVCSGVLRVLGLARAGLSDIALEVFLLVFCKKDQLRVGVWGGARFVGTGGGRECGAGLDGVIHQLCDGHDDQHTERARRMLDRRELGLGQHPAACGNEHERHQVDQQQECLEPGRRRAALLNPGPSPGNGRHIETSLSRFPRNLSR